MGFPRAYQPTARDLEILAALRTGATYAEVGAKHGISRQRVKQILNQLGALGTEIDTKGVRKERSLARAAADQHTRYGDRYDEIKSDPEQRTLIGKKLTQKKHNARVRGTPFTLKLSDLYPLPVVCPALGICINYNATGPQDDAMSIDRLDPSLGYVPGNVVLVSMRANRIKNNATLEELQKLVAFYSSLLTG
jgi:hypothetical protein